MSELPAENLPARVVPVIDLLAGQAVRAVGGRRSEYRPLESEIVRGSDPVDLAKALVERYGFAEIYAADLDALQGGTPQFEIVRRLAELPVKLSLDLGIGLPEHAERARRELPYADVRFILATEASPDVRDFEACLTALANPDSAALGLDFLRGRFRTKRRSHDETPPREASPREASPEDWIGAALAAKVDVVVALDVDRVGSGRGFAWPAGLASSPAFGEFRRKISGGGIGSIADLVVARAAGCDAVLVGTALHDGRLDPASIADRG